MFYEFIILLLIIFYICYELYSWCKYLSRMKKIRQNKHNMTNYNNLEMIKYFTNNILNSDTYANNIGKVNNKKLEDISYLELSQIFHSYIFGKNQKAKLEEVLQYKKIIYDLQQKKNILFNPNNINTQNVLNLCKFNLIYVPQTVIKSFFYLIDNIFNQYVKYYLKYNIYYDDLTRLTYYYNDLDLSKPTYLFIHGMGIGIYPYYSLMSCFDDKLNHNMIYINIPYLTHKHEYDYFDDRIILISLENFFKQNKIKKINIIAHSYGNFITQYLLYDSPFIIDKIYAIEAPNFLINITNFYYNFKYKTNTTISFILFVKYALHCEQLLTKNCSLKNCYNPNIYHKLTCFFAKSDYLYNYLDIVEEFKKSTHSKYYIYDGSHGAFLYNLNYIKQKIWPKFNA